MLYRAVCVTAGCLLIDWCGHNFRGHNFLRTEEQARELAIKHATNHAIEKGHEVVVDVISDSIRIGPDGERMYWP